MTLRTANQNGHTPAHPVGRRSGVGGAWCGLGLALLWAPMAAVIPLFPDLDSRGEVVSFWQDHGTLTLRIMALVVAGYPLLLVFLADVATRAGRNEGRPVLTCAVLVAGVMFMTGLSAALGLAAAAGLIIRQGTDLSAAYGLHVGAFVLAAPFTGAGVAFFVFVALLAHRGYLEPRWLGWLALLGVLGNVGAIGGLFSLNGPGNSGNGILGGISLPLGTFVGWTVCASLSWLWESRPAAGSR
jgi:hypothetical protein